MTFVNPCVLCGEKTHLYLTLRVIDTPHHNARVYRKIFNETSCDITRNSHAVLVPFLCWYNNVGIQVQSANANAIPDLSSSNKGFALYPDLA